MQQKKWHLLEQQVNGIQITPAFRTRPTLGSSVVGTTTLVLAPARSTSAAAAAVRASATRLALWFLAP